MSDTYKKEKMGQYQRRLSVYKKHFDIPKEVEDFLFKKYEWYDMIYADGLAACKCGYAVPTDCGEDFLLYSKTYPNDKDTIMSGRIGLDCPNCGSKFLWRGLTFIDVDNKIYLTTKSSPSNYIASTYKCDKVSNLESFIAKLNELGFYKN